MRTLNSKFFFLLVFFISSAAMASWSKTMQDLQKVLLDLTPTLSSDQEFENPKNKENISKNLSKLSSLSHELSDTKMQKAMLLPDSDPSLLVLGKNFESEVNRATSEFNRGNPKYARSVLRSLTGFCIACHTRGNFGPEIPWHEDHKNLSQLSQLEKANYYTATRRFDLALEEYFKLFERKNALKDLEWEKALHESLLVAIRYKNDSKSALKIVDLVLKNKELPTYIHENTKIWKASLEKWQSEKPIQDRTLLLQKARELYQKGSEKQNYTYDSKSEVEHLRASALLHDFLRTNPSSKDKAEALFLLGSLYEALNDIGIWSLHEYYYESCIKTLPKSEQSKSCFLKLESSLYSGYSGSGGVFIPKDVKAKLEKLKKESGL